jgi:hypothetical protein
VDQPEVEKLVGELEVAIDRLRSLYEQYFMGIEKLEPTVPRKDVDRRIHVLRKEQIRNTALRFRFQMILQRYNVFQTHWQRICREIEHGTYKRHMLRAERRFAESPVSRPPPPRQHAPPVFRPAPGGRLPADLAAELAELDREFAPAELDVDVDVELDDEAPTIVPDRSASPQRPALPPPVPSRPAVPRPAPSAPAKPPPERAPARPNPLTSQRSDGGLPEERIRQLYAQYVEAKRGRNESTASITYEVVAQTLRESSTELREKHGKAVDFEIAVKDGKTILKPVLKRQ